VEKKSGLRDVKTADFIRFWRRSGLTEVYCKPILPFTFFHSSVVKYTSSLWQYSELVMRLDYQMEDCVIKVVEIARRPSTGCRCVFRSFHRCVVNIYRYGFKSPARHGDLKSVSFVHIVTSILVNDSFLCSSFFVSMIQILQFVHLFFLY